MKVFVVDHRTGRTRMLRTRLKFTRIPEDRISTSGNKLIVS